jgi:hypothetical protein
LLVHKQLLINETALVLVEKEKLEKEKENTALLEKQLKLQTILLLNIEQHRRNSIKRPEQVKDSKKGKNSDQYSSFHQELIACMDLEYDNISVRLLSHFPTLSKRDVLICCMLLANFDTGMIATILEVNNHSIIVHRNRLRKRLKMQTSENLEEFLRQF